MSLHLVDDLDVSDPTNSVDSDAVPVRHFGLILDWSDWQALSDRLMNGEYAGTISWIIKPKIRFQGEVGEQATMFFRDPSGNALEFKSFQDPSQVLRRKSTKKQRTDQKICPVHRLGMYYSAKMSSKPPRSTAPPSKVMGSVVK